jgi:hypothetical protein
MRKDFRCRFLSYTIVLFAAFLSRPVGKFPTTKENVFLTYVFSIRYVGRGGGDRNYDCIGNTGVLRSTLAF